MRNRRHGLLSFREYGPRFSGIKNVKLLVLTAKGQILCLIIAVKKKFGGKMNPNINYIGILNLLRLLVEKGVITKAESTKIARHIAVKTGVNIVIPSSSF